MKYLFYFLSLLVLVVSCAEKESMSEKEDYSGWGNYAGTKDAMRYSSLNEITTENVKNLQVVWRYSTDDKDSLNRSQNQCNPIVIDNVLYGTSPRLKLFALNASTGKQKWIFDPAKYGQVLGQDMMSFFKVNRGVVYWSNENKTDERIFYNAGQRIYAVNASNGIPITTFGSNGFIDLATKIERDEGTFNPFIASTSPGIIHGNLLILGCRVAESADAAPGHIRAFDVITGEMKWVFHTIPQPGEVGYETWPDKEAYKKLGGANSWAGLSLDENRGILYVPTGSVSGDFYGGIREGKNLFGNSLIALEAKTGKYLWHFQTVHHDLWDRDLSANPNLVTLYKDGKTIDAVVQITKHGYIFVFDRVTGEPVFPIDETPVPQEALPGEKPWPTQPIPQLPEPFARQDFSVNDVTNITPEKNKSMLARYKKIKHGELFHPPSLEGNWIFPGYDGGGEWGGAAVDPDTQTLYVNSSEMPFYMVMVEKPKANKGMGLGRVTYEKYCFACHGMDLKGKGDSYPALTELQGKYDSSSLQKLINSGINMMPSFSHIPQHEKDALVNYLLKIEKEPKSIMTKEPVTQISSGKPSIMDEVPYEMTGYNRFLDDDGYPGIKPPWGTLNAIDLNTGKLLWKVPLGEYDELTAQGIEKTGTENYGGPVVTAGGVVFIAATKDAKIRAFDKTNGKELWEAELPVPGYATPAVYEAEGKQYLVIACGGGKIGSPSGDEYLAFALP